MGWGGSKPKDPKPTAQERALAEVAAKDWNDYQQRYVPVESQFVDRIRASEGDLASARGSAVADVEQAVAGAGDRIIGSGDATRGAAKMGLADAAIAKGKARGAAVNEATLARENAELRGLSKMAAFGRGLADQSRVGLASVASGANQRNIDDLRTKIAEQNLLIEGIGGAVGTYAGYKGVFEKKGDK